jgi:pimeloyl-ACP methyl ester carboxylesterase
MRSRSLEIKSADGHIIPAIHYINNAPNLLIASHGITTEKTEEGIYTEFAEKYLSPFFDTVVFDFRGHGNSKIRSKEVSIAGEVLDFMAVLRWARGKNYETISHLATSFGASVTLLAVSVYDLSLLSRVVFWNPVINYRKTFINASVEWGRGFFDQKKIDELAYRPFTQIPETNFLISATMTQELLLMFPEKTKWPKAIPLLIIHGDRDTAVPFDEARRYHLRNRNQTKFIRLRGVDHGFDNKINEVMKLTTEWLLTNK